MNNWLANPPSIPNSNHAGFAPSVESSMAFLQPNPGIDPAQFQNQRFLNGGTRNPSPGFHNPFPPNPVIPSKRPREESIGSSPRQAPGGLPGSRSQTPGQPQYAAYNPASNGTPHFPNPPTAFQHLQPGATSTATPSPTPQSLVFPQHPGSQRIATASPSPFSPHPPGPQMSPAHSDHASRVGTPHDNPNGYMPPASFGPQFEQGQYGPGLMSVSNNMAMNPQLNMGPQAMHQGPQRAYQIQMQMQAQARQLHAQAQAGLGRPSSSGLNQMGHPNLQMPNPQMASMQPMPQNVRSQLSPESFARGLQSFMQQKGLPVIVTPIICGRQLNLLPLFSYVLKVGGSTRLNKLNQWPMAAQHFGFPNSHAAVAGQELRDYWARNIVLYEAAWVAKQQRQGPQIRNHSAEFDPQHPMQHQTSPNKHHFPGSEFGSQQGDPSGVKPNGTTAPQSMNGYMPPSQLKDQPRQPQALAQHKASLSRQMEVNQINGVASPYPPGKRLDSGRGKSLEMEAESQMPQKHPLEGPFKPEVFPGNVTRMHGPIIVEEMMAVTNSLVELKPVIPTCRELGTIDIHALNMSLKSGILAEVRLALDTLMTLSVEPALHLSLDACDDLVEALIDCGQEQVEVLVKNASEVSDEMLISSYEDVLRSCRMESESLQDVHEMGSLDYDLDRAVDRLICITTLIRNFSFYETNFGLLGMPEVIRFLTSIIKHLGTKEMFLRSHRNALDFMKDVVIYLSNVSHFLQLPGKEEALCLLHLLLAFAPCPHPVSSRSDGVSFANYDPNVHKYTPSAIDSLAKLLARDDPNRRYYKAIFASDSTSSPAYELLTRTFGLAIAPIPSTTKGGVLALVEARKPFLLQGMLAAEILSNLAPGSESDVARSWLNSADGFAITLLKLVLLLALVPRPPSSSRHAQQRGMHPEPETEALHTIMHHGIAVLRRLAEKSRSTGHEHGRPKLPLGVVPKKENLLGALTSKDIDPHVIRQLCIYAGLED